MLNKFRLMLLVIVSLSSLVSMAACGRMIIKGQVVDAQVNKPVEGAAVWIYWSKTGSGPP